MLASSSKSFMSALVASNVWLCLDSFEVAACSTVRSAKRNMVPLKVEERVQPKHLKGEKTEGKEAMRAEPDGDDMSIILPGFAGLMLGTKEA